MRLALLVCSLVFSFLLVEILLRVFDYTPAVSSPLSGFHVADERLGWKGIPNRRTRFKTLNFDAAVATDAEGFRPVVSGVEPVPDAPEVWVLGDSTVWGWGVDNGGLFVDHLQELAGPSVRLRNFGINAYGTVQQYLLLESLLSTRNPPAKVVLMVCSNDFGDNFSHQELARPYLVPAGSGEGFEIANLPVGRKIGGWKSTAARHSKAFAFLSYCVAMTKQIRRSIRHAKTASAPSEEPGPGTISDARVGSPQREAMAWMLGRIADLCEGKGATLEVTSFPSASKRILRSTESMTLEEICAELPGVYFVEIETGMGEGEFFFGRGDFHWNAAGNRRGAEVYFERTTFPGFSSASGPIRE